MIIFGRKIKSKFVPVLLGFFAGLILIGAFALSLTYSPEVLAQTTDTSGQSGFVICGNKVNEPCRIDHLFLSLMIIINYLISVVGLVAILFIIIAGVQMTASRGQEMLTSAKKRFSGAIIGLVLVILAWVIVNSLFAGSLSVGIRDGGLILTNPRSYINKYDTPQTSPTPPGQTPPINPGPQTPSPSTTPTPTTTNPTPGT
ncbi:MAG TPA: pilin, partial [Candidatus Doudnabacteria bacterium]|nr:pilin [Candidatus Doudnabacteria bacterium]